MLTGTNRLSAFRIRWRIFAFLFGFGFVVFLQQKSITIAAEPMMPMLGLSQLQIGWLEQALMIGYTAFQIPAGIIAERFGARGTLGLMGLIAFTAMVTTPLAPSLFGGKALFLVLLGLQLLLGIAQAGTFPVSAGLFEEWFPPHRWAFVQGLQTMGLQLGAAMTPPLIASLMHAFGWRSALFWTTLPALGFILWWLSYARNSPREHAAISLEELAEIGERSGARTGSSISARQVLRVLANRNLLLLTISYLAMNYVFYLISNWAFLYLVQQRHFSIIESGWLSAAPPLAAALSAGIGGGLTAMACRRFGDRTGYRLVPLLGLTASGVLLMLVMRANAYGAVGALTLCYGCIELTEGAFWGAAMTIGRSDAMLASSIMNTGGSVGGIVGIPIVAYLSGHQQWNAAFSIGAALILVSALCWLGIDVLGVSGAMEQKTGLRTGFGGVSEGS